MTLEQQLYMQWRQACRLADNYWLSYKAGCAHIVINEMTGWLNGFKAAASATNNNDEFVSDIQLLIDVWRYRQDLTLLRQAA